MIIQELKKLTKKIPKDRDNEWGNQVHMLTEEKNTKVQHEELERWKEKERGEEQENHSIES